MLELNIEAVLIIKDRPSEKLRGGGGGSGGRQSTCLGLAKKEY